MDNLVNSAAVSAQAEFGGVPGFAKRFNRKLNLNSLDYQNQDQSWSVSWSICVFSVKILGWSTIANIPHRIKSKTGMIKNRPWLKIDHWLLTVMCHKWWRRLRNSHVTGPINMNVSQVQNLKFFKIKIDWSPISFKFKIFKNFQNFWEDNWVSLDPISIQFRRLKLFTLSVY